MFPGLCLCLRDASVLVQVQACLTMAVVRPLDEVSGRLSVTSGHGDDDPLKNSHCNPRKIRNADGTTTGREESVTPI